VIHLPDQLLRALGRVTASFAALEAEIAYLVWLMLPTLTTGFIVTAELSARSVRNLALALFRDLSPKPAMLNELAALLKQADAAEQKRNRLLHSIWLTTPKGIVRHKITAKGALQIALEPTTGAHLESTASEIEALTQAIAAFRSHYPFPKWA
jgi:hypothetical protein